MAITKTKKYKKKRKKQKRQEELLNKTSPKSLDMSQNSKDTYNLQSFETCVFARGKK